MNNKPITPKDVPFKKQAHMNLDDCYVASYASEELGIYLEVIVHKDQCGMVDENRPSNKVFTIRGVNEKFGTLGALLDYYNEHQPPK